MWKIILGCACGFVFPVFAQSVSLVFWALHPSLHLSSLLFPGPPIDLDLDAGCMVRCENTVYIQHDAVVYY